MNNYGGIVNNYSGNNISDQSNLGLKCIPYMESRSGGMYAKYEPNKNNITELILDYNQISSISQSLKNIQALSISNNNVTYLHNLHIFLPRLERLNISNNKLISIEGISKCIFLHTINMSFNRLSTTNIACLSKLPNLRTINLANNNLTSGITHQITKFQGISEIDISNNRIKAFIITEKIHSLKMLIISGNQMIKCHFNESLPNLEILNLKSNSLNIIKGLSNLTQLRELNINNNIFEELPYQLKYLGHLKKVSAGYNHIKTMSCGILQSLEELYLNRNQISKINFLTGFCKLKIVDLAGNSITRIPKLYGLEHLSYINLDNNKLERLENVKESFPNVEIISLNTNNISNCSVLGEDIKYLRLLKDIKIQNNPAEHDGYQLIEFNKSILTINEMPVREIKNIFYSDARINTGRGLDSNRGEMSVGREELDKLFKEYNLDESINDRDCFNQISAIQINRRLSNPIAIQDNSISHNLHFTELAQMVESPKFMINDDIQNNKSKQESGFFDTFVGGSMANKKGKRESPIIITNEYQPSNKPLYGNIINKNERIAPNRIETSASSKSTGILEPQSKYSSSLFQLEKVSRTSTQRKYPKSITHTPKREETLTESVSREDGKRSQRGGYRQEWRQRQLAATPSRASKTSAVLGYSAKRSSVGDLPSTRYTFDENENSIYERRNNSIQDIMGASVQRTRTVDVASKQRPRCGLLEELENARYQVKQDEFMTKSLSTSKRAVRAEPTSLMSTNYNKKSNSIKSNIGEEGLTMADLEESGTHLTHNNKEFTQNATNWLKNMREERLKNSMNSLNKLNTEIQKDQNFTQFFDESLYPVSDQLMTKNTGVREYIPPTGTKYSQSTNKISGLKKISDYKPKETFSDQTKKSTKNQNIFSIKKKDREIAVTERASNEHINTIGIEDKLFAYFAKNNIISPPEIGTYFKQLGEKMCSNTNDFDIGIILFEHAAKLKYGMSRQILHEIMETKLFIELFRGGVKLQEVPKNSTEERPKKLANFKGLSEFPDLENLRKRIKSLQNNNPIEIIKNNSKYIKEKKGKSALKIEESKNIPNIINSVPLNSRLPMISPIITKEIENMQDIRDSDDQVQVNPINNRDFEDFYVDTIRDGSFLSFSGANGNLLNSNLLQDDILYSKTLLEQNKGQESEMEIDGTDLPIVSKSEYLKKELLGYILYKKSHYQNMISPLQVNDTVRKQFGTGKDELDGKSFIYTNLSSLLDEMRFRLRGAEEIYENSIFSIFESRLEAQQGKGEVKLMFYGNTQSKLQTLHGNQFGFQQIHILHPQELLFTDDLALPFTFATETENGNLLGESFLCIIILDSLYRENILSYVKFKRDFQSRVYGLLRQGFGSVYFPNEGIYLLLRPELALPVYRLHFSRIL